VALLVLGGLGAELTHPDIAALVTPLYAARKEGMGSRFFAALYACQIDNSF
jgi:hypothetical protein